MEWIDTFDLFLFDFDGLLVSTEHLHFQAYKEALKRRGLTLPWNMQEYGQRAYFSSTGLKDGLKELFPAEFASDAAWSQFYKEKTVTFMELVDAGNVELMPGVEEFLKRLSLAKKTLSVVTHSTLEMISRVRKHLPLLDLIPHWITREDYALPKPASDGYNFAIEQFLSPGAKAIGFEDSVKGLKALIGSKAKAVLICEKDEQKIDYCTKNGAIYAPSFDALEGRLICPG